MTGLRMGAAQIAELVYRAELATWEIGEPQPVIRQLVASSDASSRMRGLRLISCSATSAAVLH